MGACTSCRATADESVIVDPAAQVVQQAAEEGLALIPSLSDVSQFQNVGKCKFSDHFTATVKRDGKTVSLGTYKTAEEAALAYAKSPEGRPAATERHAMKEAATKALMCFDTDGNGLDQTEFTAALQAFRFSRDGKKMRNTISNIFAKCDVDGNGRLTAKVRHPGLPWPRASKATQSHVDKNVGAGEAPIPPCTLHPTGADRRAADQRPLEDHKETGGGLGFRPCRLGHPLKGCDRHGQQ